MNKFKNLASKLIKNKLWCSEISYIVTSRDESTRPGFPTSWLVSKRIALKVVIKSVSKNLVDNVNIFNTDSSIVIDATTLIPKPQDYIVIKTQRWKIVAIIPLGVMDNEPTAYEIVMRLA